MDVIRLSDFISQHYIPYYKSHHHKDALNEMNRIMVILRSEFAQLMVNAITHDDITLFLLNLQHERGSLKMSTLNRYRARVSAILNFAVERDFALSNPTKKVKKYTEKPRGRTLSWREAKRLLAECRASRNKELYVIVVLALNTGMRRNEILSLKKNNVNIRNKNIVLEHVNTKSGEGRFVPLNDAAIAVLKPYINSIDREQLFISHNIRSAYTNAMKRAGINQAHFHDLRRTFATHLKDHGIPIHTMMKLLGHSSIAMTERYLSTQEKVLLDSVAKISFT